MTDRRWFVALLMPALILCGCGGGGTDSGANFATQLSALSVTGGPLAPTFSPSVETYQQGPSGLPRTPTITATAVDPESTIAIDGAAPTAGTATRTLTLAVGSRTVPIVVRSGDGTSVRTYEVELQRTEVIERAYLKAAFPESEDFFGAAVAVDGDTVVVGMPNDDSDGSSEDNSDLIVSGSAYVYRRTGASWALETTLRASNAERADQFGFAVAIHGDTIAVSAVSEDGDGTTPDDNSIRESGAVYVFARTGSTWTETAYLKAPSPGAGDGLGRRLVLHQDTLVAAATGEDSDGSAPDDDSVDGSGAVYVFVRDNGSWVQQAYLKAAAPGVRDGFGEDLSMDGDTLVVGTRIGFTTEDQDEAGLAYVFERTGSTWTAPTTITHDASAAADRFGWGVSIEGDLLAVTLETESSGVDGPPTSGPLNGGGVVIFERANGSWVQTDVLKSPTPLLNTRFGQRVRLVGRTLAVSSFFDRSDGSSPTNISVPNSGAVHLFAFDGSDWAHTHFLKASVPVEGALFGLTLAFDGTTIVTGSSRETSDGSDMADTSLPSAGAAWILR